MSELSVAEIMVYKAQLIAQREVILDSRSDLDEASAVVELDQTRLGRLSRMDALQAQAMSQALQERNLQQLSEINQALKRIEQGDFGDCQRCDELISGQRLDANPSARHCIKCAD